MISKNLTENIDRLIRSASCPQDELMATFSEVLSQELAGGNEIRERILKVLSADLETQGYRTRIFKQCEDLCEGFGNRRIALIFRCMILWPIVESIEALTESKSLSLLEIKEKSHKIMNAMVKKARMAHPKESADGTDIYSAAGIIVESGRTFETLRAMSTSAEKISLLLSNDLENAADAIENLCDILHDLGAISLLERAHTALRSSLAFCAQTLIETENWTEAALVRARYLRSYYLVPPNITPDRSHPRTRYPMEQVGANIANFHFKANMVHGALLLENIIPPDTLVCFSNVENLDHIDTERFAEDLVTLRFQLSSANWKDFGQGYATTVTLEEAKHVLKRVEEIAPDVKLGQEEKTLPFQPLKGPHWVICAIRFVLRNSKREQPELKQILDKALGYQEPEQRIRQLQIASLASESIDAKLYQECLLHLASENQSLITSGETIIGRRQAEVSLKLFSQNLDKRFKDVFLAQREHAAALNTDNPIEKLTRYHLASELYFETGDVTLWHIGLQCLKDAKRDSFTTEEIAKIVCHEIRLLINMGMTSKDRKYISAAIHLFQETKSLPEPYQTLASALVNYGKATVEPDETARLELLRIAKVEAERVKGLDDFTSMLNQMLPESERNAEVPEISKSKVDDAPKLAKETDNWEYAIEELTREISSLSGENDKTLRASMMAGQLALAYGELADQDPRRLREATKAVSELAAKYASLIPQIDNRDVKRSAAGGLGWALARLPTGIYLTQIGVELLELAVSIGSPESDIVSYSFDLSNLANAYRTLSQFKDPKERKALLIKAEKILCDVISIDERLYRSDDPRERQAGETLDLDYLNLGLIRESLSNATYDTTLITEKPLDSAQYLRGAIEAFSHVIEKCDSRPAITATAQMGLARCFTTLCQHYYQERHWAGGDLEIALYNWMCEVAGSHINTTRWIMLCAESALNMAAKAADYGLQGNASVMMESTETIVDLWCLLRRSDMMPEHVRLHCAMLVAELWDHLLDSGRASDFAEQFKGFEELASLARATCQIDLCRKFKNHSYLLEGLRNLSECTRGNHPVIKGIAQLALKWLRVEFDKNGCSTNGLYLGSARSNELEFRFSDQRRSIKLTGMSLYSSEIKLVHKRMALDNIRHAVAHLEPMLNLDRVPEYFAVGTTVAVGQDAVYDIETMRIPTPFWDSWLVNLSARRPSQLTLEIAAPFIGRYEPIKRKFSHEFPTRIEGPYEALSFGERGFGIEILMPDEERMNVMGNRGCISVDGSREHPVVHIETSGCRILFKTTPRVLSCELAILIKDEETKSALCCTISPPVTSPSRSFPSTSINSFAPIFFFRQKIESKIISFFRQAEIRSLVIVGQPDQDGEICRLLEEIYDPTLEVLFVVNENEAERAIQEVEDFHNLLSHRLCSKALFASETAYVGKTDPLCNVQFVVVSRPWAPAAVQMLLDISELRRINMEGLPIFHEGKVTLLNIKGNNKGMRWLSTMLPGVSAFKDLILLYAKLQQGMGRAHMSKYSPYDSEQLERLIIGKVPKRPLYMLPEDSQSCIALAPHIRLNQALPVPMDEMTAHVIEALKPQVIYSSYPPKIWEDFKKPLGCKIIPVPATLKHIYETIVKTSDDSFSHITNEIRMHYPHLRAQSSLLESLRPSRYAMLCTWSDEYAAWAIIFANYAAALGGPILFAKEPNRAELAYLKELLTNLEKLKNPIVLALPDAFDASERQAIATIRAISSYIGNMIQPQLDILDGIAPNFVGVATPFAMLPFELAGTPPLALRFAVGRLSGPDLASTCEIITRAALAEEISRKVWLEGMLIGASGSGNSIHLISVLKEIESTKLALTSLPFVRVKSMIDDPSDRDFLNRELHMADFFHFAGHAGRKEGATYDVELLLTGGSFTVKELPNLLYGHPIVFANACSSALTESVPGETTRGLASEFLRRGAINYIGNLWPVLDDTAATMACEFYRLICSGMTVGEALMRARKLVFTENESSWGGIILFGFPRNRIADL